MNPVELLLAAAAYGLLRANVGRCGRVFSAASPVYYLSSAAARATPASTAGMIEVVRRLERR